MDLSTERPISGRPANLRTPMGNFGNPDSGISATICWGRLHRRGAASVSVIVGCYVGGSDPKGGPKFGGRGWAEVSGSICTQSGRLRAYRQICDFPQANWGIRTSGLRDSGGAAFSTSLSAVVWRFWPKTRSGIRQFRRVSRRRDIGGKSLATWRISARAANLRHPTGNSGGPEIRTIGENWRWGASDLAAPRLVDAAGGFSGRVSAKNGVRNSGDRLRWGEWG